jgi:hypothetical protein
MKDDQYYFHQTPVELAKKLIEKVNIQPNDSVLEPFKGEGAFYNNLPNNCVKYFCEIEEGRDYKDWNQMVDWVITNPPFKIDNKSMFYNLILHFLPLTRKGVCFLGSDSCFGTLTPKRIKELNDMGYYINKIYVSSVKKWYGRYYFIIISNNNNNVLEYIDGNF